MSDTPAQASPEAKPAAPEKKTYTFEFQEAPEFTAEALYVKGFVEGTMKVAPGFDISFRSLTGEEIGAIEEAVKVSKDMTVRQYNTESTYWNLAFSVTKMNDKLLGGTPKERADRFRKMASPVLTRLQLAYIEFCDRVDELLRGKEASELAKKS